MKTQNTSIKDANGRVTAYGFACGYVELTEHKTKSGESHSLTLWKENGAWHVREHNHTMHKRIFWACPETLATARKSYDKAKRALLAS